MKCVSLEREFFLSLMIKRIICMCLCGRYMCFVNEPKCCGDKLVPFFLMFFCVLFDVHSFLMSVRMCACIYVCVICFVVLETQKSLFYDPFSSFFQTRH